MPKIQPHLNLEATDEHLKLCLQPYNIQNFTWSPAESGVENTTVFINTTDHKRYVMRVYKKDGYTSEQIDNEISFSSFLAENDIPVPPIIPNARNQKRTEVTVKDTTWQCILMQKMPGEHLKVFNPTNVRELAYYIASMHRESLRYKKFTEPPATMRETIIDDQTLDDLHNPELKALLDRARTYTIAPLNLPHALIHSDINRGNSLFENDMLTAILDFEAVHHGYFIEDLAATLFGIIRHILYKDASPELLDVFLSTYQIIRPLSHEELIHLPDFLIYRTYYLACADYLMMENEDELQEDLEMETKAVEVYREWLHTQLGQTT